MLTPVLFATIGWRTYIIFTCTLASFVPIVYFFYPETSNLSLEEVDNLFLPVDRQVRASSISYHPESEKARRGSYSSYAKGGMQVEKV